VGVNLKPMQFPSHSTDQKCSIIWRKSWQTTSVRLYPATQLQLERIVKIPNNKKQQL